MRTRTFKTDTLIKSLLMKKIFITLFLTVSFSLFSQEFSMDLVKNMTPRNIGPGGMSGRVTSIDVVNSNPDIMYVGTASGGNLLQEELNGILFLIKKLLPPLVQLLFSNLTQALFGQELVREILETALMVVMASINL